MAKGPGKRVLITGASSGIGLSTALYLAEKGYSVVGTSRSMKRLDTLREEAERRKVPVEAAEMDINSDEGVEEGLSGIASGGRDIDVLVNNAGYNLWGPAQSLSMRELKAQFETNFFAAVRLTQPVLPGMIARRHGTIVNVSSVLGRIATPFSGGYAASKFALEGLSEALRIELWPFGVRVAVVEPGLMRTDLHRSQVIAELADSEELPYQDYIARYRKRRPRYGRLAGDPIKVARVIHKIARSRRPGFRYSVGPDARLGTLAVRLLPERLFQTLLARATLR